MEPVDIADVIGGLIGGLVDTIGRLGVAGIAEMVGRLIVLILAVGLVIHVVDAARARDREKERHERD